jgi:hypothetical protein
MTALNTRLEHATVTWQHVGDTSRKSTNRPVGLFCDLHSLDEILAVDELTDNIGSLAFELIWHSL